MKKIEPHIRNYIDQTVGIAVEKTVDVAVKRAVDKSMSATLASFQNVVRHEIGLLQEFWRHEFALAMEICKDKPDREEVREIAREEIRYHGLHR